MAEAAPLPDGWEHSTDPNTGNTYYVNDTLGLSQWEPPLVDADVMAAMQASAEVDADLMAAIHASAEAAEIDWISDCLFAVFSAPTWVVPIASYIDEHCGTFEDMEENKLEYTPIHNGFKQLVDDLLTAHLLELSVTPAQFTRFCQQGLNGDKELHRSIIEPLLSVDDFLVFKAMMVKRSADLHREVLLFASSAADSFAAAAAAALIGGVEVEGNDEVDAAEAERLEAQRRCVEAELQLAIALSLQLEQRLRLVEALEERLRLMERLSEVMEASAEFARQAPEDQGYFVMPEEPVAPAPAAPTPTTAGASSAVRSLLQEEVQQEGVVPASLRLKPLAPLKTPTGRQAGSGGGVGSVPMQSPPTPLVEAAPIAPLSNAERMALEKRRTEAALQRANRNAADRALAAPVGAATATAPAAPTGSVVAAQAAPQQPLVGALPSQEERLARAEHLRRQREALMEKKRAERETELNAVQKPAQVNAVRAAERAAAVRASGGRPADFPGSGGMMDAGRILAAELSGKALDDAEAAGKVVDVEAAAAEMRRTITRQLKESLASTFNR